MNAFLRALKEAWLLLLQLITQMAKWDQVSKKQFQPWVTLFLQNLHLLTRKWATKLPWKSSWIKELTWNQKPTKAWMLVHLRTTLGSMALLKNYLHNHFSHALLCNATWLQLLAASVCLLPQWRFLMIKPRLNCANLPLSRCPTPRTSQNSFTIWRMQGSWALLTTPCLVFPKLHTGSVPTQSWLHLKQFLKSMRLKNLAATLTKSKPQSRRLTAQPWHCLSKRKILKRLTDLRAALQLLRPWWTALQMLEWTSNVFWQPPIKSIGQWSTPVTFL